MEILTSKIFWGIVAGVVSFIAHPLYVRSIIKKETTPHIFTWLLATILAGVSLFFYNTAGGGATMFMLAGDFIGFAIIAGLSLIYGKKNRFYFSDWVCLFGALFSVVIFIVFRDAFWAFVAALSADAFALFPTIKKTYYQPLKESFLAWTFTCIGNVMALFAMNWANNVETVYVYTVLVMDGIVWLLIFNKKEHKQPVVSCKQKSFYESVGQIMHFKKSPNVFFGRSII